MLAFPNTKINLGLYILNRREDNYHNLLTCFLPVLWNDVLEIVPSEEFEFVQTGLTIPGDSENNLCVKAYQLLKTEFKLPNVRIHLHKIVPMGAGLGGGSSDGSSTLKTLNAHFKLGMSNEKLSEYALKLGSDCPFFIQNKTAIGTGRGEVLEDFTVNLSGIRIVIVYPEISVSTADAFSGVQPRPFEGDFKTLLSNPENWKENLHNQFEETVFPKHPVLAEIKEQLYASGAFYAAMTGSGSAIFGLYKGEISELDLQYKIYIGTL